MEGNGAFWDEAQRHARMIETFDWSLDWASLEWWPEWAVTTWLKAHKNRKDRYNLFVFFVMNGLAPQVAARLIMVRDADRKHNWIYGEYDKNAHRHLFIEMPKQLQDGNLTPRDMRVFDIIEQRPLQVSQQRTFRNAEWDRIRQAGGDEGRHRGGFSKRK